MLVGIDASRALRPVQTGTESYARQLIAALSDRPSPFRYRLYVDRDPQRPLGGWRAVETRVIRMPRLWTHLGLSYELLRHPPDVLFVPAHVVPIICPAPAVVTIHDIGYLWYRRAYRPVSWVLLHLGTIQNARAARIILADSEATAGDLVRHFRVPRSKIRVAYLGGPTVEPSDHHPLPSRLPDLPERYFLFIGTLQPRKNLARLLRAFAKIGRTAYPSVGLVIAGREGPGSETLRALSQRLGVMDRVHWLGYVADADRASLYVNAVAFVFPSLYEGFGLPILEAMAFGTPIISSTAAALPEIVGNAGLLVDPFDVNGFALAMRRLLDDSALRESLIARGYRRVTEFTWDRCAAVVEAAFNDAV